MTDLWHGWEQRFRLPLYIARHPANKGHVGRALLRAATFQIRSRLLRRPQIETLGAMRLVIHAGNASAAKVVYGKPPDYPEMQAWARILEPGQLFVDVGANVGVYSLWAAGLGARVLSFEPEPAAADRFRENLVLNPGAPIELIEAAVTDHSGEVNFSVGADSLSRIGAGPSVEAVRLDDLITDERVRGLKIDVEGFERLVLDGARGLLGRHMIDFIQLEWNSASTTALSEDRTPLAQLLQSAGYELSRPDLSGVLHPTDAAGFGADVFAVSQEGGSK